MDFKDFESSLMGSSFDNNEELVAVKAEDVQSGGGFDFSKYFWEPQVGCTYLVKFLPNPGGELITHRSIYRSLPDPDRKGKTFRYVSSGSASTCPVLSLFFDLHAMKKEGDAVAAKKIEKYLSRTQQACARVQILHSPKKEEIGQIRMFVFSSFGPNAIVANLINEKLNPTKEQKEAGFERQDIFNIFSSPVLSLVCKETTYDGIKGRDFSGSAWAPKQRGAVVYFEDGTSREFKATDNVDGKLAPEAAEAFKRFVEVFKSDDYNPKIHFAYRPLSEVPEDDPNYEYLKSVQSKVDRIVPIIREKSLTEIAEYGTAEKVSEEKESRNITAASVPDELQDIVGAQETPAKAATSGVTTTPAATGDDELDDILNG